LQVGFEVSLGPCLEARVFGGDKQSIGSQEGASGCLYHREFSRGATCGAGGETQVVTGKQAAGALGICRSGLKEGSSGGVEGDVGVLVCS
jgi:hypothetical protein